MYLHIFASIVLVNKLLYVIEEDKMSPGCKLKSLPFPVGFSIWRIRAIVKLNVKKI